MQMRAIHEKEMADIACQTTTKKDAKNGRSGSAYELVALALGVYKFADVYLLPRSANSPLDSTWYKVFSEGSLHKMFPLEPLLLPPSRFETRALQQGPSTQISLTLHCFLVWTSPASLSEAHMHISLHLPGPSFSSGTHSWTQDEISIRLHMRRFRKKWILTRLGAIPQSCFPTFHLQ